VAVVIFVLCQLQSRSLNQGECALPLAQSKGLQRLGKQERGCCEACLPQQQRAQQAGRQATSSQQRQLQPSCPDKAEAVSYEKWLEAPLKEARHI
jgi:hypothetical protein